MYLKSKISLNYNDGITGQKNSVIMAKIESWMMDGDCNLFGANFVYADNDSEGEEKTIITKGAFELKSEEEIQGLYDMVKSGLPSLENYPLFQRTLIYSAFRLEMYKTFLPLNPDLVLTDIEINE